jgi:hypothetical protein
VGVLHDDASVTGRIARQRGEPAHEGEGRGEKGEPRGRSEVTEAGGHQATS